MAPIAYDFVAPSRIVFGWGRRREVGGLARSLGRRAFVVCGSRTLERDGALADILKSLADAGLEAVCAATISHEPLVEDVDKCVAFLRERRAGMPTQAASATGAAGAAGDFLLAIGGGSAIDLAKAAGALITQDRASSVLDYLEGVGKGLKIVNSPLPMLAMPTTAGTGSEATKNAVISSYNPPFKKSLRSELMVPRVVLIDPELSVTAPPHITAWTGMDAITQLVESYISRRATVATQQIALTALRVAGFELLDAFRDGGNRQAREAMAQAALLSGIALANSGLGMAHGVAAALGVHCHVPHGLACAVMLPAALRTNRVDEEMDSKLEMIGWAMQRRLADSSDLEEMQKRRLTLMEYIPLKRRERADWLIARIDGLVDALNIPRRLSQVGVKREQIPAIVRDSRGNSMSGNPRDVSDEELTRILEEMH